MGEEEHEDHLFMDAAKRPCLDSQLLLLTDLSEGPSRACTHHPGHEPGKGKKDIMLEYEERRQAEKGKEKGKEKGNRERKV